jgi:hypothetical protein
MPFLSKMLFAVRRDVHVVVSKFQTVFIFVVIVSKKILDQEHMSSGSNVDFR